MGLKLSDQIWTKSSEKPKAGSEIWYDDFGVKCVIFQIGPDRELLPLLSDLEKVRKYHRDHYAKKGIGIIECDLVTVSGNMAVKTLAKRIEKGKPDWYMGAIAIPMKKQSYVLTLYAQEKEVIDRREDLVLSKLKENEKVEFDMQTNLPKDWECDPYFPNYLGPSRCNLSDNVYYDYEFPEHSLSKLRLRLRELITSVKLPEEANAGVKPWWKIW